MKPDAGIAAREPRPASPPGRGILRLIGGAATALLLLMAGLELGRIAWGTGDWLGRFSFRWALAFGLFALLTGLALALVLLLLWQPNRSGRLNEGLLGLRCRLGWLRWPLATAIALVPGLFLIYTPWGDVFTGPFLRLLLYLAASLGAAFLLTRRAGCLLGWEGAAGGLLLAASGVVLGTALVNVRSYPFALGWSEGNRMWDYSVYFARRLYDFPEGEEIFAYIDRGRQTLWGLPFLLPQASILLTRLWSAVLFTVPYALLGWIAFRRPSTGPRTGQDPSSRADAGRMPGGSRRTTSGPSGAKGPRGMLWLWLLAGVWVMVFLNQGPIYTPLVLSAILVAVAHRLRGSGRSPAGWGRLLLGALLVLLAGYYAQLSRFTWMFAPAMWAGMLALSPSTALGVNSAEGLALSEAEEARESPVSRRSWLCAAVLVTAGVAGGFVIPRLTPAAPGGATTDVTNFSGLTDFITRQPLLWYRLLPNATYDLGILLGLLLATGPLIAVLAYLAASRRWPLNRVQKLAVILPLLAFLLVGLVISTKIGGGSNLHNLDMFLIGLVLAAALAWDAGGARFLADLDGQSKAFQLLVLGMVAIPALFPLWDARPLLLPPAEVTQASLETLRSEVRRASGQGEVLMMDQRQLLTFGQITDLPLVDDYEKKYLMDQALTGDAAYFETFYRDLAAHRFSLIVSHPVKEQYQGSEHNFGEENDAWSWWVARAVLCYYEPVITLDGVNVQLLAPRAEPGGETCPEG